MSNVSRETNLLPAYSSTWYKVPYLTGRHFCECYNNITYFQNVTPYKKDRIYYKRKENDISEFSSKSRVRALKKLSMIDPLLVSRPYFVTLTYHEIFPAGAREIKRDLDSFIKRLKRLYPVCHYFWRIELQKRGAPHFHFIIWFPIDFKLPDPTSFHDQLLSAWLPFTKCGCNACKRHSIDFRLIDDYKKAIYYVSKYLAKSEPHAREIKLGRIWGLSRNIPITQKQLFIGHHDFITLLQHACILWNIQYTLSNKDYLIDLLFRPTIFLFIPHKIVERLAFYINSGCDDPLKSTADDFNIPMKREISGKSLYQSGLAHGAPTYYQCIPAHHSNLPVIHNAVLCQVYETLCLNTRKRKCLK